MDLPAANHNHGQDPGQGFFDWDATSAPVLDTMTSEYDFGAGMDTTPDGASGGVKHPQPVSVSASVLQFQDQWLAVDPSSLVDFDMGGTQQQPEEDLVGIMKGTEGLVVVSPREDSEVHMRGGDYFGRE
jgi:hypothetical protein